MTIKRRIAMLLSTWFGCGFFKPAIGKAASDPLVPGAGLKKPQPNHVESNMAILLLIVILL
jgi:hypothetical protein